MATNLPSNTLNTLFENTFSGKIWKKYKDGAFMFAGYGQVEGNSYKHQMLHS